MFFTVLCNGRGICDRVQKAQFICVAVTGMAKSSAVIDGGADNGETQSNVDTGNCLPFSILAVVLKALDLKRDMPLVVVHDNNDVIPPAERLGKNSIRRDGLFIRNVDAFTDSFVNGGLDLVDFLGPKEPSLAAVRV